MDYVKHFDIDGVETRQVACIELHGKPNAATEGCVGVLGIDMDSPFHEVYKCVAVNGSIYNWELLSSGLSIMSATISGGGAELVNFQYDKLKTPTTYVVKIGDLIIDNEGYLYQIDRLDASYCVATYCGTRIVAYGMSAYQLAVENGFKGTEDEWFVSLLPYVGNNGTWWVGETDTGKIVQPNIERRTEGTGSAYTASVPHITVLEAGKSFVMIPHTVSTSTTPTLNVNGLGAREIRRRLSNQSTVAQAGSSEDWLASGNAYTVTYDGSYWIVEGLTKPNGEDIDGIVPIKNGGTGASTVADALSNLGLTQLASIGAKIVSGTYTGSDSDVTIKLGDRPKQIIITASPNIDECSINQLIIFYGAVSMEIRQMDNLPTGTSPVAMHTPTGISIMSDGFKLSYDDDANIQYVEYSYVAFL